MQVRHDGASRRRHAADRRACPRGARRLHRCRGGCTMSMLGLPCLCLFACLSFWAPPDTMLFCSRADDSRLWSLACAVVLPSLCCAPIRTLHSLLTCVSFCLQHLSVMLLNKDWEQDGNVALSAAAIEGPLHFPSFAGATYARSVSPRVSRVGGPCFSRLAVLEFTSVLCALAPRLLSHRSVAPLRSAAHRCASRSVLTLVCPLLCCYVAVLNGQRARAPVLRSQRPRQM